MLRFILHRAVSLIFVLFSLTFLTFLIGRLAPGDPILVLMGGRRDPDTYERLRHLYGFDRPIVEQYVSYVGGLLRGDFGLSLRFEGVSVNELIAGGVSTSVGVGGLALVLSVIVGVPLGIIAALRHRTLMDRAVSALTLTLYSVPSFVIIPVLWSINLAAYRAGYPSLPQAGWGTPEHLIMPVVVLAAANVGYIARLTRSSMLEVLRNDYIRVAQAKGLMHQTVVLRHALRNAILPIITLLGPATAYLVTGAFVVENLFNIPGIGRVAIDAVGQRDYAVIQGTTVILGLAVVVMNLVTDLLYQLVDPRVRLTE